MKTSSLGTLLRPLRRMSASGRARNTVVAVHQGRILELVPPSPEQISAIAKNNYLASYATKVGSQAGEEGVLDEVFRRMKIAGGWCVEFGAYDGKTHSNTWHLITQHGWKSVQIEPFAGAYEVLERNYKNFPEVYCLHSFVTCEGPSSLDSLLGRTPIPADFDLMVVDIDGNDYHVWSAVKNYHPKVVMIEFNPFIAPDIHFVKPLEQNTTAAASLAAICELARRRGYELVCVVGGNAIFVRSEFFHHFSIEDNRPQAMFSSWGDTKIFQGFDGTLILAGLKKFVWKYQINQSGEVDHVEFSDDDVQILPKALRVFRPRLSYRNTLLEQSTGILDAQRVPANQLLAFRKNVASECGEDGILIEIFRRLDVKMGLCVDVGAHDGVTFSNTRALIEQGWRGLLIEKDAAAFGKLAELYHENALTTVMQAEVRTAGEASLDAILKAKKTRPDFDLLCIDVEGNDYNLWSSLSSFNPRVVVVDINPTVPNDIIFAQADDPAVNHGASLRAFIELARAKNYELAAVTSWNAIFVHQDLFPSLDIRDNKITGMYYPVFETKIFQSMDSFLTTQGYDQLVRHQYFLDPERLQPLPPDLRLPADVASFGTRPTVFFTPVEIVARTAKDG